MSKSCRMNIADSDRWPTSVDHFHQQQYADWFQMFDWGWYATFTFDRPVESPVRPAQARVLLEQYLRELEASIKDSISCLILMEQKISGLGTPAGDPHFHLLLGKSVGLTDKKLSDTWQKWPYGGNRCSKKSPSADVRPYDPGISATYYLFKTLHESPDNWSLRRPELISPTKPSSTASSSRLRRSLKRQAKRRQIGE